MHSHSTEFGQRMRGPSTISAINVMQVLAKANIQKVSDKVGMSMMVRFMSTVPKPQPAAAINTNNVPSGCPDIRENSLDSKSIAPDMASRIPTKDERLIRSPKNTRPAKTAQAGMV